MTSTRSTLRSAQAHLRESMGSRSNELAIRLGPAPSSKDAGRRPSHGFGSIDTDKVVPDPQQPRSEFSEEAIDRLAASIRETGQLSPIRVRWSQELNRWVIIAGERRWRAAKQAGLASIECFFHEDPLSPAEILEQQLIENLLREDLQPIDEARGFAALMELNDWNGKQVAAALHVSPSKVARSLSLLRLPEDIQLQVERGELAPRSAYELSKLDDRRQQRKLAHQAAAGKLTHEQAAQVAPKRRRKPSAGRPLKLTFFAENELEVVVTSEKQATYHDVAQALQEAQDEVHHRIENNTQLF